MSSTSAHAGTTAIGGAPTSNTSGGAVDLRAWFAPANIAMATLLLAGFVALCWDWLLRQHRWSSSSEDWSHAYLVPLVSGYLIYRKRAEIARLSASVFWPGLLPLLVGVATYMLYVLTPLEGSHLFQGIGMVLTVAGVSLLLLGPAYFGYLAIPIGYLALAITLPDRLMFMVTFQMQIIASQGAWALLNLVGLNTEIAGNTLTIITSAGEEIPLNVAEACSGMRMVIAFLALGVAVAFISCSYWWQRVALILLAVPVALLTNVIRVASLGMASVWNPELAAGDAHMLIGILWLLPAFLAYMGLVWILKKIMPDAPTTKGGAS